MRARGVKRDTTLKSSALEERLDEIVSLLRERNGPQHAQPTRTFPTPGSSELSPSSDSSEEASDQDLTEQELATFRDCHLPDFPLVNIPADYTAAELQKEKPTAALAVKALTSKEARKQIVLGKRLREVLTQRIMIDGERSLPLLVSLLMSIAW